MADSERNRIMSEISNLEDDFALLKKRCTVLKEQYCSEEDQTVSFTVFAKQEELGTLLKRARELKAEARHYLDGSVNAFDEMNDRIDDLEDVIYRSYQVKDRHSDR